MDKVSSSCEGLPNDLSSNNKDNKAGLIGQKEVASQSRSEIADAVAFKLLPELNGHDYLTIKLICQRLLAFVEEMGEIKTVF